VQVGLALAYVQRAVAALERAAEHAAASTTPWGEPVAGLQEALGRLRADCERENSMVFYQPIPHNVPRLPEPKTLTTPLAFHPAASQQFPEYA
jgi:hypothetical protein